MKSKLKIFQIKKAVKVPSINQQEKVQGRGGAEAMIIPFQTSGGD